ncbi:hypothetical protein [Roseibium sediminis]|uniref:hypothetical protein n=1 Tax=Roseibium sediminis TaxID=1775174 RepID=UPI00123D57B4|nr:hypothetical protein [Roseibium sediminis]
MKTTNKLAELEALNEDYTKALAKNASSLLEVLKVRSPAEQQQLYDVFSGFATLLPDSAETRAFKRMIDYYQDEFWEEEDIGEEDFPDVGHG